MTNRQPLGPPPVDAMSEVAWTRVERGLWARLDDAGPVSVAARPARRWIWLAVPAAAVIAVIAFAMNRESDEQRVAPPDTLSRVVSGAAPSSISFGDSHIELEANSAVIMNRQGPSVLLEQGAAWFTVAPRDDRPPFVVIAGDASVRVVGTRFRVARDHEHARVRVDHGLVEVRFHGQYVRIGANQEWSSEQPSVVGEVAAVPAQPHGAVAAVPPTRQEVSPKPEPPASSPVHPTPAKPHQLEESVADRDRFEKLTALEARDPEAALSGYLELARGTSSWSELALFAGARLAADRGDPRAQALLVTYLQRFPKSANALDARQLLDRLKGRTP